MHHGKALENVAGKLRLHQLHQVIADRKHLRGVVDGATQHHFHHIANLRLISSVLGVKLIIQSVLRLLIARIRVVLVASTHSAQQHGNSCHHKDTFFHFIRI